MQSKRRLIWLVTAFIILGFLTASHPAAAADKGKTLHVLHSFCSGGWPCLDGAIPEANLIFDASGNLYGTTYAGGIYSRSCNDGDGDSCGKAFELTPGANGKWTEKVLHRFRENSASADGTDPAAGLIFDAAGNLYGTTVYGGLGRCVANYFTGCGTVFELTPRAKGRWAYTVLHNFSPTGGDGYYSWASLVLDKAGNLYGTTSRGGSGCNGSCGTVFELSRSANGQWTEKVLYSFGSTDSDAAVPYRALIFDAAGNLYGTTYFGGQYGYGTVFQLAPSAKGQWTEKVLHSFDLNDGGYPESTLVFDAAGNLYGTTSSFLGRAGAVFKLARGAHGEWKETVLHEFAKLFGTNDGNTPIAGLIFDAAGNLYGTTLQGGDYGSGTVFKLTRGKKGKWTEKVVYSFNHDDDWGGGPWASVILDNAGNLYGTTVLGGDRNNYCLTGCGTVFEITP